MAYFTKREEPTYNQFIFIGTMVLGWNISHTLHMASTSLEMAYFFFRLQMLFIPFIPLALLLCILKIAYPNKEIPVKYLILLFIMPVATVIINFTNDFHQLFRLEFVLLEVNPPIIYLNERGPWFWIHTAYSYIFIASAALIAVYQVKRTSKQYRFQYYMLFLGVMLSVVANFIILFWRRIGPIDNTLWGLTFSLFFFYFSLDTNPTSTYILARSKIFESLNEYFLVLDTKGRIIDMNRSAREWLLKQDISSSISSFDGLLDRLREIGVIVQDGNNKTQRELLLSDKDTLLVSSFTMKEQCIYNNKNIATGSIVTLSDMTAIRQAFRNLQSKSSIDSLTGVANRNTYEETIAAYEESNTLPLCIMLGDVNGLKTVNDKFGHLFGDEILRITAGLISECVREQGFVARIGGDEFIVILPGYVAQEAEAMMQKIKNKFADNSDKLHGAGIALGYEIKIDSSQKIKDIVSEADKKMYRDKRNERRTSETR